MQNGRHAKQTGLSSSNRQINKSWIWPATVMVVTGMPQQCRLDTSCQMGDDKLTPIQDQPMARSCPKVCE